VPPDDLDSAAILEAQMGRITTHDKVGISAKRRL
jgi:hypothetical protein